MFASAQICGICKSAFKTIINKQIIIPMKRMLYRVIPVILFAALFLSGCQKDEPIVEETFLASDFDASVPSA